jgi:hypothetical protein
MPAVKTIEVPPQALTALTLYVKEHARVRHPEHFQGR